ncbi:MAG TPA: hypothetical protein VFA75_23690 [Nevskia sp.]|nr:hypothetical protein [Nevskia sp.]
MQAIRDFLRVWAQRWRWGVLLSLHCLCACSVHPVLQPANHRPFRFERDSLAFENKLASGRQGKEGEDDYTLHCFVITRSARQFFQFARFDGDAPALDDEGYRKLVKEVIAHDPSEPTPPRSQRIVIPGYWNLHAFSKAREDLLKDELGSAMDSFMQRGNWRMVFPFSHEHQEETALSLAAEIRRNRPPVVHLVVFPALSIDHAVLLYGAADTPAGIRYEVYDPNDSARPASLFYDRSRRSFNFPANKYFAGGEVDVYEIYRSAEY